MALKDTITEDMKNAMRAKQTDRLGAIRLLIAAIKQREIDDQITLDDPQTMAVVEKLVKQRRDSITQYEAANRQDLADKEKAEIEIYQAYLPEQADDAEVSAAVQAAIEKTGASGMADMGKVMGIVKGALAGRADMSKVSALVRDALK